MCGYQTVKWTTKQRNAYQTNTVFTLCLICTVTYTETTFQSTN